LGGDVKQPKTKFAEERRKGWDAKKYPLAIIHLHLWKLKLYDNFIASVINIFYTLVSLY